MTELTPRMGLPRWILWSMAAVGLCFGCGMREITAVKPAQTPGPLQTAAKPELIEQYNKLANSIPSINASVTIQLTAGSSYSGVIQQYHEVNGFVLARKPSDIRVIGQV